MRLHLLSLKLIFILLFFQLKSQENAKKTTFNGFGHLEADADITESNGDYYFQIGEHDFFINSQLTDKISFLGENVIRFDSKTSTGFSASIERARLKFDYYKNHSFLVGKVHTPVNYWNDVYHHGRLFFPTVARPLAFSYLIPLHNLGFGLQGQNLGNLNFGYDIFIGNGIGSTDNFDLGSGQSITLAFHMKPTEGMRLGASYYNDFLKTNVSGVHSGHSSSYATSGNPYKGSMNYELACASFAYFLPRFECLNEFSYNRTKSDSLGLAENFSNYIYLGYRVVPKCVAYVCADYLDISKKDLHSLPRSSASLILGARYEFSYLMNIKFQAGVNRTLHGHGLHGVDQLSLRLQFAYGF
ncbi:MAG: hypothetical protein ACK5D5_02970 [Bacteroidota bacterium]|jgi:hypothetical protein